MEYFNISRTSRILRLAAATDGLSAYLVAMDAKQVILEERCARLERAVRTGSATSARGALPVGHY